MRFTRCLIILAMASLAGACAREPAMRYYMVDPQTGQRLGYVSPEQAAGTQAMAQANPQANLQAGPPMVPQQMPPAAAAPRSDNRGFFGSSSAQSQATTPYYPPQVMQAPGPAQNPARGAYAQVVPAPQYNAPAYGAPTYAPPRYAPQPAPSYAQPQYTQQPYAQPQYAQPQYAQPRYASSAATQSYASAPAAYRESYMLDTGDKLRIVVFGQDGISSLYTVDAGGNVTLPLIGPVPARGVSTVQLANDITQRLKQGYVREPKVTVEVDAYRPFFILGEVTTPGQYAYTPNMTAETAVAIAGGFAPRASKSTVKVTRNIPGQQFSGDVPLNFALKPGDTVLVKERWF